MNQHWIFRKIRKVFGKPLPLMSPCLPTHFFCKGALFRGKGGPPVLEEPARHLPRQGRGFVRPPICPTPPAISSFKARQAHQCYKNRLDIVHARGGGLLDTPVRPTSPAISSTYEGASGGQLIDCWHHLNVACISSH